MKPKKLKRGGLGAARIGKGTITINPITVQLTVEQDRYVRSLVEPGTTLSAVLRSIIQQHMDTKLVMRVRSRGAS